MSASLVVSDPRACKVIKATKVLEHRASKVLMVLVLRDRKAFKGCRAALKDSRGHGDSKALVRRVRLVRKVLAFKARKVLKVYRVLEFRAHRAIRVRLEELEFRAALA